MRRYLSVLGGGIILGFLVLNAAEKPYSDAARIASHRLATASAPHYQSSLGINPSFGKMPLYFIRNEGQVDSSVGYYIQGKDKTIYFTSEGLTYVLSKGSAREDTNKEAAFMEGRRAMKPPERENRSLETQSRWVVKLDFVGANRDVRPAGEERTEAVISYFRGSPEEWKTGLPTFSKIVYRELWPGIDLVYYGSADRLKYEFIVHPGADPSQIRLAYRGASAVEVNEEGRLEVVTPAGTFEDDVPVAWQEFDGKRVDVAISYDLHADVVCGALEGNRLGSSFVGTTEKETGAAAQVYGFHVGDYDRTQTLVLDPAVLVYCGYIGGKSSDYCTGIAVDSAGNAYIAGYTGSTEATFPVIVGPDLTYNDRVDAFVAKVNPSGTALSYCGYIGGSGYDYGYGISVDGAGNAYITGYTSSTEATFPVMVGPDLTYNGDNYDAFVAKVNSSGTALSYCGYIGGNGYDYSYGIGVDNLGNAYITGETESTEATFPVKKGPDVTYNKGLCDAFVAKVNSTGSALLYCGYIGGGSYDYSYGIALDSAGNAYVTGYTWSSEATFPVTVGPDLTFKGEYYDAFVAKVDSSGTALSYCGYIGGSDGEKSYGIAVDSVGSAYVTGETWSTEAEAFPVTVGPDLTFNGMNFDAFVAKVDSSGSALSYCGYIGGSHNEEGLGIAVDSAGNAYVTGDTLSSEDEDFPVTVGPDLTFNDGFLTHCDAFIAKVNSSGTALSYCGYIGGSNYDYGRGIAVDRAGIAYVTGGTKSTQASFPVIVGPDLTFNDPYASDYDGFIAKVAYGKEDFLGTWDGQGVYFRNSETGKWIKLASPADLIETADIEGDGTDDLIGIWPTQGGVWMRYSSTGAWSKLCSTARDIATGDMNGDGLEDFVATWDGQGVYYRNSMTGTWVKMATPATQVTAGDLDGDTKDDLIGIWPAQGGVWVKYSKTGTWAKLSSTAQGIASGDVSGDGREDFLGTWDGQGVYYRNSMTGTWVKMATAATLVAAGDIDGNGAADLIGSWPAPAGVWVKYSIVGTWSKLSSTAHDIAVGRMRGGVWDPGARLELQGPAGGWAQGPIALSWEEQISAVGPGGPDFIAEEEENLIPYEGGAASRIPGPGEPGFRFFKQKNLVPRENSRDNRARRR